jgi:3-oxoacyl-[acyl-carrier protein] reductase
VGELDGQVALVTGASRGIGRAIAIELARAGAGVAVTARTAERAAEAASQLPGEGHAGFLCEVSDEASVDGMVRAVEERLGPLEIVVNNAGVTEDNVVMRLSDEAWDRVLDTNLKGAFHVIRTAVRGMMRRRSGRIINLTSIVGITGNRGQASYAASKAGLIGLTKSVARELAGRGILCNAVAPGFIETEMTQALPAEARDGLVARIALGRLGRPEDVAGVVRFLAGPGAAYITGQVIVVDGGMVI